MAARTASAALAVYRILIIAMLFAIAAEFVRAVTGRGAGYIAGPILLIVAGLAAAARGQQLMARHPQLPEGYGRAWHPPVVAAGLLVGLAGAAIIVFTR